jgi:hypothetical protein
MKRDERKNVVRLLSSNYVMENDFNKRTLAKLSRDVLVELGLKF